MQQALFKKYADIKTQIKFLEESAEEINKQIVEGIKKEKLSKEDTTFEFGTFSLASRKEYTFSPKTVALKEKWEIAKTEEIEKGIAKVKVDDQLRFTPPKAQ